MAIPNDSNDPKRYYRTLELKDTGVEQDAIKKAYRALARKYHPDAVAQGLLELIKQSTADLQKHGVSKTDAEEFSRNIEAAARSGNTAEVEKLLKAEYKAPDKAPDSADASSTAPGTALAIPGDEPIDYFGMGEERTLKFSAATFAELKSGIAKEAKKVQGGEAKFKEISQANDVLSDAKTRQVYDLGDQGYGYGRGADTGDGTGTDDWFSDPWFERRWGQKAQKVQEKVAQDRAVGRTPDVSNIDITFMNLSGMDLHGVKFGDSYGTNFTNCNLTGADFSRRSTKGAKFYGATLDDANFSNGEVYACDFGKLVGGNATSLKHTKFGSSTVSWSSFNFADLDGTDFTGAALTGIRFGETRFSEATKFTNLRRVEYTHLDSRYLNEQQKRDIRSGGGGASLRNGDPDISVGMGVAAAAFAVGTVALGAAMRKNNKKEIEAAKAKGEEPDRKMTFKKVASITLLTTLSLATVAFALGALGGRGEGWADRKY